MWDDIDVQKCDDNETHLLLGSLELLGVTTDPPTAETIGGGTLAVAVSSEGMEEEKCNDRHPCQGLPTANPCGFNRAHVASTTMPRLQFKTSVYY